LKDAHAFIKEYNKTGVKFPVTMIVGEFKRERAKLDDPSPVDDIVSERDPKTGAKKINHHYILHESQEGKPIDGILYLEGEQPFTTSQFEQMCRKLRADVECLDEGVPMAVLRADKKHLKHALERVPEVKYAPFKDILPKVVAYVKKKFRLKDAHAFIKEYNKTGVKFPVKMFVGEFKREHAKLDDSPPVDDIALEKDPTK